MFIRKGNTSNPSRLVFLIIPAMALLLSFLAASGLKAQTPSLSESNRAPAVRPKAKSHSATFSTQVEGRTATSRSALVSDSSFRNFISDDTGNLFSIDPSSGAVLAFIGQTAEVMFDIAFDPSGNLYGVDSTDNLYRIDVSTATATLIGSLGVFANSLEFRSDGALFAAGYNTIYSVNTSTGSATALLTLPSQYQAAGDLAFDAVGNLYLTTLDSTLIRISPDLTTWTAVGSTGVYDLYGLIYGSDGILYGFSSADGVYTINLTNAATTSIASFDSAVVSGVTGAATDFKPTLSAVETSSYIGAIDPANPQATEAEPVSTGNGNYFYTHTDLAMPDRGLPLVFQRAYNTLDSYSGPLGAKWDYQYNIILAANSTSAVIKWGDGHSETYVFNGTSYTPPPGVFSILARNDDGTFTLTKRNRTRYNFSPAGKLASIVDRNGNQVLLSYDAGGHLTTITGTGGRTLTLTYDGNSRITSVTDSAGRSLSFSYDANDNLVQAVDPAGGVTTYAYDGSHHVTSITLPNGNVLLQNVYDSQGRVISQTNGRGLTWTFAYDTPSAGQTTITDPLGNKAVHTYDSSLRITKIANALGGNVSYSYDANNDRTSVTNQDGKMTLFTYDSSGNVTGITDPLGNTSAFTYDANNDMLSATNPRGETTSFSYDAHGNLTGIQDALGDSTAFTYDGYGELVSKQDARGNTTSFAYDGKGDLTEIMDSLGDTTKLAYDAIGRLVSVTDGNGHTASASYDALSRLTSVADPLGDQTQFAYDPVGDLTEITDADSHATQYGYDAVGNLLTVTNALGHVTHYAYDDDNNRISFTNANGAVTSYAYDALNRLARTTDPLGFVRSYAYDPVGNVTATTDPNGNITQFRYDALNRLVGIAYADGSTVAYTFDADGNRTAMTDFHGTTTYSYDALDRLTTVSSPEGTVGYAYDAVGNRSSLTYPDGKVVVYKYDAANRLVRVKDWHRWVTRYVYDAAGNLRHVFYPNSAAVAFKYDPANRLIKVHNRYAGSVGPIRNFFYTLDPVGNRVKVTNGVGVNTRYVYDALNELIKVRRRHRVIKFAYDAVGNRLTIVRPKKSVTYSYDADDRLLTAGSTAFTYDPNGNRITETTPTATIGYTYDDANRLILVSGGDANSVFSYDGDGNRVARNGHPYVNDVAGVLTQVLQEQQGGKLATYVHGLGLISESGKGFNRFYQYDGLGSVVGLTNKGGALKERYNYNAWGKPAPIPLDRVGRRNPFRFTGEALDPGTGLYYLRARYYDPMTGRFLTKDAFPGFATLPPNLLNQYSYTGDSPLTCSDPSGFSLLGDLANVGSFSLWLSATTIAKGFVGTLDLVTSKTIGPVQPLDTMTNLLGRAQQVSAIELTQAVGNIYGVSISRSEATSIAEQVTETVDISSALLSLADAGRSVVALQREINVYSMVGHPVFIPSVEQGGRLGRGVSDVYDLISLSGQQNYFNEQGAQTHLPYGK